MERNEVLCCRICSIGCTLEEDFVDLLEKTEGIGWKLTFSGSLYEELMGVKVLSSEPAYYPKNICNYCDLQLQLFKRLKGRALKSFQKLEYQRDKERLKESKDASENREESLQDVEICSDNKKDFDFENKNYLPDTLVENDHNDGDTFDSLVQVDSDYFENQEKTTNVENLDNMLIVYGADFDFEKEFSTDLQDSQMKVHEVADNVSKEPFDEVENTDICIEVEYFEQKNDKKDLNDLQGNKKQQPPNVKIETSFCKCKECDVEFATLRMLRIHRQKNHSVLHRCTKCSKVLRSVEAFEVHMNQHLGLPAYSCEQCNKTFKQKVHYQYHMKRHNNERNFSCECGKKFVSKSDLSIHMRKHSGVRPFTCPIGNCGKKCYTEQHLNMHMCHHSNDKKFECDICHRKFVSPTILHTHRQTIHFERRFECTLCGKKFRRKHHLEVHILTHENETISTDDGLFSENMNDSFAGSDSFMDMTKQVEATSEMNFEQFIEFSEYNDEDNDEFLRNIIESDGDNDYGC